jgi:hypothetical protein
MIRTAQLVRYDKLADSGRNRPLRVVVETDDGVDHEAVMKPAGWGELTIGGVTKELLSAAVGALVGLPLCEPFIVEADAQLIGVIEDDHVRNGLTACAWPAFATSHAGKQWQNWSVGDQVTDGRRAAAMAILLFDAVADNADRGGATPNLLVKGDELRAIDHELCFSAAQLIGVQPKPPWQRGGLEWMLTAEKKNVLMLSLAKTADLDFDPIRDAWAGLADAELDAILHLLPHSWGGASALAQAAIQRTKDVRDHIDACIVELKRMLS